MTGSIKLKLPTGNLSHSPQSTTTRPGVPLHINTGAGTKRPHSTEDSPSTTSPTSQTFKRPRATGPSLTTPTMTTAYRRTSYQQQTPTTAHPLRQSSLPGDPTPSARSVSFNSTTTPQMANGRQYSPSVASATGIRKTTGKNTAAKKRNSTAASSTRSGPSSTIASEATGISKRQSKSTKPIKAICSTGGAGLTRRSLSGAPSTLKPQRSVASTTSQLEGIGVDDGTSILDSDDDGDLSVNGAIDSKDQENEKATLRYLIQKFTPDQNDRYDAVTRYSLTKRDIKRLANATASQSLTANIITAMRSMAKTFVGELIEDSVGVQREWLRARQEDPMFGSENRIRGKDRRPILDREGKVVVEETRPPLLPEHVAEALRRYRIKMKGGRRTADLTGTAAPMIKQGVYGARIGRVRLR